MKVYQNHLIHANTFQNLIRYEDVHRNLEKGAIPCVEQIEERLKNGNT